MKFLNMFLNHSLIILGQLKRAAPKLFLSNFYFCFLNSTADGQYNKRGESVLSAIE